jgi:hypothetical protein
MLTADLLLYKRRKGRVIPEALDPEAPAPLEAAQALIGLFAASPGQARGDIEAAAGALGMAELSQKAQRGLLKLLFDGAEFGTEAATDPLQLRHDLFEAAAQRWRDLGTAGLPGWRAEIVAAAAAERGITAAAAEAALFADLPSQQRMMAAPSFTARGLLQRYNSAQVQGLLLGAQRIDIDAANPTPQRLRQMLRWLKFFGLLFREEPRGAPGNLHLVLDGPLSVLEGSTRYGLQLAEFFPALLLWAPPWRLHAMVRLRAGGGLHELIVEPHPHLQSHYPDHGQWVPDSARRFAAEVNALDSPWRAEAAEDVLMLAGNRYLVPDFVLRHADEPEPVLLEQVLIPVPETLPERLTLAKTVTGQRYVIACRATPAIQEAVRDEADVFLYKRNLTASAFVDWLEGRGPARRTSPRPRLRRGHPSP